MPPRHVFTHLWLLQVFNSGVRGICGWIFIWTVDYFLSWSVFEPVSFGSSVRHSTTVPPGGFGTRLWLLQVFNSGVRGICGRIFIWTVDYFLSWSVFEPGTFGSSVRHSTTVPQGGVGTHLWLLQVFNSGVRGICGRIFIWTVDYFLSWSVFEPGTFGSSVRHSTTVPLGGVGTHLWLLQVFNSGVRGICGRIFIWTVDYFLSWSVFEPGTFGSSVPHSTTVPPGGVGTHLWLLQVFNSEVRAICGRIFIWTVDYFLSWPQPPGVLITSGI